MPTTATSTNSSKCFADVKEAVMIATYIEQMLASEQQWIMNRLSWLFISQSFLITAFAFLINSKNTTPAAFLLLFGLPILGFVCCVVVGLAIIAAEHEGNSLADERARVSGYINDNSPTNLPLIGTSKGLRNRKWTLSIGALPHRFLPWIFAFLWLTLLTSIIL